MSDEHRLKIKNSNILNALIEHVEGTRKMSATQCSTGLGLLRKVMPDLSAVEHSGTVDLGDIDKMTDAEIYARLAELRERRKAAVEPASPPRNQVVTH